LTARDLGRYLLAGFDDPETLFQIDLPGVRADFPPLRATPAHPPLPWVASTFVGRAVEIAMMNELVASRRMVTLVGTGGSGKTRLALEVARRRAAAGQRVAFAELASQTDRAGIVDAVAAAAGVAGGDGALDRAAAVLEDSPLLVLDNCEHLLDSCAEV